MYLAEAILDCGAPRVEGRRQLVGPGEEVFRTIQQGAFTRDPGVDEETPMKPFKIGNSSLTPVSCTSENPLRPSNLSRCKTIPTTS